MADHYLAESVQEAKARQILEETEGSDPRTKAAYAQIATAEALIGILECLIDIKEELKDVKSALLQQTENK